MGLGSDGRERLGTVLRGKWRLEALLGTGGMGHVYAATHRNGMRGAVKVLHRGSTQDAAMLRRFLREGYVANRVQHPGAVKMLDDDVTDDGSPFLVMELVSGEPLSAVLARTPRIPVDRVLDVLEQSGRALQEAHARGLVHRDIKPGNILITPTGQVKITDFGIAKVAHQVPVTKGGLVMGTAQYLSPEQAAGDDARPASDVSEARAAPPGRPSTPATPPGPGAMSMPAAAAVPTPARMPPIRRAPPPGSPSSRPGRPMS